MMRRLVCMASFVLLLAGSSLWLLRRSGEQATLPPARPEPTRAEFQLQLGPRDDYVTSSACRDCHAEQFESWHASFHRQMTQLATPQTVLAETDDVTLTARGRTLRVTREGDEFWVEMADPDFAHALQMQGRDPSSVADPPRVKRRIVMTTGSHHYQGYWIHGRFGNDLRQLPFVWLIAEARWIPREDAFLHPPGGHRHFAIWNRVCIQCHSVAGQPRHDRATNSFNSHAVELGIACESCHGPGRRHVERMRQRRNSQQPASTDLAIVDPRDLSPERSSQACGQCHATFHPLDPDEWWDYGYSRTFKPGQNLTRSRLLVVPESRSSDPLIERYLEEKLRGEGLYWRDGTARVGGREFLGLLATPCYQRGDLSCLSCHSMHDYEGPDDQMAPGMRTDRACLGCHPSYGDRLAEHTHHGVDSAGSRCQNCHMPHTSYALFKGIRSHRIDSPAVENTVSSGKPNACNLCHLDRSLEWTAEKLTEWYAQPPVELEPDEQNVSAAVLWLLKGDAAQRAVTVWASEQPAAGSVSGRVWMVPFLAQLLDDPYSPVRLMAWRSLRSIPGYDDLEYDFLWPEERRRRTTDEVLEVWRRRSPHSAGRSELLQQQDGTLDVAAVQALLRQRDDKPISISE